MVLIPEERLLRYEERDKQKTENRDGIMYGGGEDSEETQEDSLSVVLYSYYSTHLNKRPPFRVGSGGITLGEMTSKTRKKGFFVK